MASLYLLTEEDVKTGHRPKTPRQKQYLWNRICLVLTTLIILENAYLVYYWISK